MAKTAKKESRKIKHLLFTYYAEEEDPRTGQTVRVEKEAAQGEVVELDPWDIERGERFGSFYADDELVEKESADGESEEVALSDLDPEELRDWLTSEGEFEGEKKPSQNDVLKAAAAEPALAERILEAENLATGNDPRSGLVKGLTKVIQDRDAG